MPLPHNVLVLVADGRKTLFLRNHGDAAHIDLRTETHAEREDHKDRDIKSDAPGMTAQRAGYGRPVVDEANFHQLDEERWAADTASELDRYILNHEAEALAIIAPPRTLGALRKKWHKEVEKHVILEIPKEMTGRPIPDIEALVVGTASPPD